MGANASSTSSESPTGLGSSRSSLGYKYDGKTVTPSGTSDHLAVVVREKKKRMTGFATLRKKLIRRRRTSKSYDHAKVFRELVSEWTPLELNAVVEEYEALGALKDLVVQAELARPPASTFKQDLSDLFDFKACTDVDLVFQGAVFPVHRPLLSSRCTFFRGLLGKWPGYGAQIQVDVRNLRIDIPTFSALLRYLYTGELSSEDHPSGNLDVLLQLGEEFGLPNPLEQDLRYLLETGDYADAVLVFTSDQEYQQSVGGGGSNNGSDYGFHQRTEVPCHKAILSARSPFFRNLIQRRTRSGEEYTERALHIPTRIVLDESVIPKRYARVLLQALYLDVVDLSSILHASPSAGSLGEAQALAHGAGGGGGRGPGGSGMGLTEEAMELYQIGRFLELDILAQGCEDLIVESISMDNIVNILRWSDQPYGSSWVRRQAMHFLREEFQALAQSSVLFDLDKTHLMEAMQSDFLQASEFEILQAVLRWGEQRLVRRMEDREPNLLNHTAHSVAKKGVKKRDLSDVELREILSDVLPHVRMDHVLPPTNEVLSNAIKRGLVSTPPSHMIGDERENLRVNAWIRCKNNGLYVKPRLFMPYYEEAKALLSDQLIQQMELVRLRRVRMSHIPDTLYMVEDKPHSRVGMTVEELSATIPVPDAETITAMLKREQRLRQSPAYQRACSLPLSSRHEVNRQVWLRVVREFGLPDSVAEVLEGASYCCNEDTEDSQSSPDEAVVKAACSQPQLGPSHAVDYSSRSGTYPGMELPAVVLEGDPYRGVEMETSSCSEGHLSDIMPDVAMATSSFSQLHLMDQELELDLGDGASHSSHIGGGAAGYCGPVDPWPPSQAHPPPPLLHHPPHPQPHPQHHSTHHVLPLHHAPMPSHHQLQPFRRGIAGATYRSYASTHGATASRASPPRMERRGGVTAATAFLHPMTGGYHTGPRYI